MAEVTEADDDGAAITLMAGQHVFCDLMPAGIDLIVFPETAK
jgi:hypothetical protein